MNKKYSLFFIIFLFLISFCVAVNPDIPVEELKRKYANSSSKFMDVMGMQVHYRDEGKGPTIVLIHGTASSLHTWDSWANELKKKYRVIRIDLPGFGLTGPDPNKGYSIQNYTHFLSQFLSKFQLDSLYLAGNSLGGNISWNYAADHPSSVKKLILIDPSGYPMNKKPSMIFKIAKTPVINSIVRHITPKFIIKNNLKQVYFDDTKVTKELITRYHDFTLREGNRQAFIDKTNSSFIDSTHKLKNLKTKCLILWGENDLWIPVSNALKFKKVIPNAKLIILPNTGHLPMEENPYESLSYTKHFLLE